jgi:hypothetical protein
VSNRLVLVLLIVLYSGAAWADGPVLDHILPQSGRAGSTVILFGSGFGADRTRVKARFGPTEARVITVRDASMVVEVPLEAPRQCDIVVERQGAVSRGVPFTCTPSVKLSVAKNPLRAGERTRATFRVYHESRPVDIHFVNRTPQIVHLEGGDEQTRRTSGGEDNSLSCEVVAVEGNEVYDIAYDWKPVEDQPPPSVPVSQPVHHCQGGRLILIIGDFENPTIKAALDWSRTLPADHLHRLAYNVGASSSPTMEAPSVRVGDTWRRWEKDGKPGQLHDLVSEWTDCCFFQEVIVFFHGHQVGGWDGLIRYLPFILGGKPVKKLVLWSCESTDHFLPGLGGSRPERVYRLITWIARPRACPCECDPSHCRPGKLAPLCSGETATCPRATDRTVVIASGSVRDKGAKLGIDPADASTPFASPDGRLRVIEVSPETPGTGHAQVKTAARMQGGAICIFAGKGLKVDPGLVSGSDVKVTEKSITRTVNVPDAFATIYRTIWEPSNSQYKTGRYGGPKCKPPGDGCQDDDDGKM